MALPVRYAFRSLFRRKGSTALTLLGLALVVAVFAALSALNAGIVAAYEASGEADNLLVLRQGSETEGNSRVSRDRAMLLRDLPGVAHGADGAPLVAAETVTIFNLEKTGGGATNVLVRGVSPASTALRRNFKLVSGRVFTQGLNELMVGEAASRKIRGLQPGATLHNFGREWTITGTFSCGRSAFSSEIWGDVEVILPASENSEFSSVLLRAENSSALKTLTARLDSDPRFKLSPQPERAYYRKQTEGPGIPPIFKYSRILCYILAFGALFGAANLLYASVAQRRREISTLRVLGFSRGAIAAVFLGQGLLYSLIAGAAGVLLAWPLTSLSLATTNFETFTTIAFQLHYTPAVIGGAALFGLFIGAAGSLFPALQAARLPILEGLRK